MWIDDLGYVENGSLVTMYVLERMEATDEYRKILE
jgi:hypothetical protein